MRPFLFAKGEKGGKSPEKKCVSGRLFTKEKKILTF